MNILDKILVDEKNSGIGSQYGRSPKVNTNSTTDFNRASDESELKMTPMSANRQLDNAKSLI
jgi:hypothetical protein